MNSNKMKQKQYTVALIMILMVMCVPAMVMAQPPDPGGSPDVPVDGGLSVLLAAGVGYVVKKGRDRVKKKNAEK